MIKSKHIKYFLVPAIFIVALFFFYTAKGNNSATIQVLPSQLEVNKGDEFELHFVVDSKESMNAFEAVISYPTSTLDVVGIDRDDSVADVWIESPRVSRNEGKIEFLSGTKIGVGGENLHILDIQFKALKEGLADIFYESADVIAADGKGTSILSETFGASIKINPEVKEKGEETGELISETEGLSLVVEPEDEKKTEEDIKPEGETKEVDSTSNSRLPEKPQVSIPLFPNQSTWYNYHGPFNVFWAVTDDIDKVAVELNKDPFYKPENGSEEVCCGKRFERLDEGSNYVHVRFHNEFGWGETYHHKIGVDTELPLPFKIDIKRANSRPSIDFETQDAISGVKEYRVYLDDEDPIITSESSLELPSQSPGQHSLKVRAYDMAGNFVESVTGFTILGSEGSNTTNWSDNIWIFAIVLIFGIASWFIFKVFNSENK